MAKKKKPSIPRAKKKSKSKHAAKKSRTILLNHGFGEVTIMGDLQDELFPAIDVWASALMGHGGS